jgi:hypothetical protein
MRHILFKACLYRKQYQNIDPIPYLARPNFLILGEKCYKLLALLPDPVSGDVKDKVGHLAIYHNRLKGDSGKGHFLHIIGDCSIERKYKWKEKISQNYCY